MKPYLKYKDSGIEWIGEIPEHWEVTKLKYSDKVIMGQSPNSDDYNDTNEGLPFLQGNADFKTLFPKPKVWCETANKIAEKEDVLLSVRAPIGAVNIADQSYGIGRGLCAIRSKKSLAKLLFYLALSLNDELNSIGTGSTYTAVSIDDIANVFIPNIPPIEQQTIATYLDRKTHLIDTLIENKQKLIDFLKEQRAAIINHAVTKGLNPNVKLKDSGIEWLGEIPKHWAVKKLKYTIRLINEKVENGDKYELLIALENIEGFTGKLLNGSSSFEGSGNTFKKGDVLFNKLRPYLCKVVLTPQDGVAVGELLVFRPNDPVNNRFLFYRILSTDFISIVNGSTYGAKMPRASWEFIRNLKIPLSPIIEQQSIVDYLDAQTTRMDKSIEKQGKQIDLLKEYRTAFISEVVTGKIDVRDSGIQEVIHS